MLGGDKVDSALIEQTARVSQPSKRSRGVDYPIPTTEINKKLNNELNRDGKGSSSSSSRVQSSPAQETLEIEETDDESVAQRVRKRVRVSRNEGQDKEGSEESDDDDDDDGTKRFWALKAKEGVKRPGKKSRASRDVRLFCTKDAQMVRLGGQNGPLEERAGHYCQACLAAKVPKAKAFFIGNHITTLRRHLASHHYGEYLELCAAKSVEAKAHPPSSRKSKKPLKTVDSFPVVKQKPAAPLPVTEAEHLLELIVDANLPFRFVDRPSFRRLVCFLNPKLTDKDIPKKTCMANMVDERIAKLDGIDRELIAAKYPVASLSYLMYVDSPLDNPYEWNLKNHLIAFHHTPGRHSGLMVGRDLVEVIKKFNFGDKLGWIVCDNVSINDVGVSYACTEIDPNTLDPKEVRGRCIEHTFHLMACHFIKALRIPALATSGRQIGQGASSEDDGTGNDGKDNGDDDDFDVDTSMQVEAAEDDVVAIREASIAMFDAGDVVDKLMAFIAQLRSCDEGTRVYLETTCTFQGCPSLDIKCWVRTRWRSLSDCFHAVLRQRKAIDVFCLLADNICGIPPLQSHGKAWSDYRLTEPEWRVIELAYKCLKIIEEMHGELSVSKTPTIHKAFPFLEKLQSDWEDLLKDGEYEPVHHAIEAGLKNVQKWYQKTDDTSMYFVSHVLDPTRKRRYLDAAWEPEWIEHGMKRLRAVFLKYQELYQVLNGTGIPKKVTKPYTADDWMDRIVKEKTKRHALDRFEELERFLNDDVVPKKTCPEVIHWWGLKAQEEEYPVVRLMARDYLAIPGSSCLAEHSSSSISARTDEARRRQMGAENVCALQRLRAAYRDGRLEAVNEAWMEIEPDFDFETVK